MKRILKDIANVQMGYPFRTRLELKTDGSIGVIQMKDLSPDNHVTCETVQKIDMDINDDKHFVRKGDLFFRSRGITNTVAILDKELVNTIAAAPLFRIRTDKNVILPEYLWWYINRETSQRYLGTRLEGTHGGMISRLALENLPVDIPSLETQKEIVEIIKLHHHRQELEKKRIDMQERGMSALLMSLIKGR
ncbi:MAG: restriction endonuclease subunit S [Candidatus Marinimicrobia bacterium]|nr:restriction endonuclease subunit S [Candidatus Neomarinimicrobiota bacterium]